MMKVKKNILCVGLISMMIFGFFINSSNTVQASPAEDPIIFKIALTDAPFIKIGDAELLHHSYAAMLAFQNSLEKSSAGRIKVELYPYGRLGDVKSNIEQILSGSLQGATPPDGSLAPFYKNIQVFSIPYLFNDPLQAYEVFDGPFGQKLFDDMAKESGLRVLSVFDNGGFRNFTNSKKEIKTADDMKGLKFRTMDIPAHMEMVKALGGAPTPVAWMELYGALQTGVVDGQENSAITTLAGSLQEVQKYCILDGHFFSIAFIVTSEEWLRSLPEDLQNAVIKAGKEAAIAARGTVRANESLAIEALKKAGMSIYVPTPEELQTFKKAQEPVIKWLKDNIDASFVDDILDAVKIEDSTTSAQAVSVKPNEISKTTEQSANITIYILLGLVVVIIILFLLSKNKNRTTDKDVKR